MSKIDLYLGIDLIASRLSARMENPESTKGNSKNTAISIWLKDAAFTRLESI
jgi:hypothetical protein